MTGQERQIFEILKIGHDAKLISEELSLSDVIARTRYKDIRAGIVAKDLLTIIEAHANILDEWIQYSEDKRTEGGWYILRKGEIGQVNYPESKRCFKSLEVAVSEYVLRELDFWVKIQDAG